MSTVYNLEPPTKGKVTLKTTVGDLDIELWPKEAPKAVRNFVQLCLEGYYDGVIFHRVIKDFMAQTGDPTGTGEGGESIYGGPFKDEFHSRLRFNHRGLVACANKNSPHSNGSQFFITLDKCEWLDKQNTIFGKIVGDTVYNMLRLNDLEAEEEEADLQLQGRATKIKSAHEVLRDDAKLLAPEETPEEILREQQQRAATLVAVQDKLKRAAGTSVKERQQGAGRLRVTEDVKDGELLKAFELSRQKYKTRKQQAGRLV
eukprot:gene3713-3976_t